MRALFTRLQQGFNEASLPRQIALVGTCLSVALPCASWAIWGMNTPLLVGIAMSSLCTSAATLGLSARTSRSLQAMGLAAQALRADPKQAANLPLLNTSQEARHASVKLRRLVDTLRKRERALESLNQTLSSRLADRTHELSTLQDLSIGLSTQSDLHGLVNEALSALEQTVDYTSASMWGRVDREAEAASTGQVVLLGYRTGDALGPAVPSDLSGMRLSKANLEHYEHIEREGQALIENDARQSFLSWLWSRVMDDARSSVLYQQSRSWMALPLTCNDEVLGVMRVDHQEADYFDAQRVRLLTAVSSQAALAMRHAQLLRKERDVAVVAERNRIARDLHDAVSQTLFAAHLIAGTLVRSLERDAPVNHDAVREQVRALETLSQGALAEMRVLMFELRPDALQKTPLAELLKNAIEALAGRGDITVSHALAAQDDLPPDTRVQLYRIAQEALSNIAKHSGATQASVQWSVQGPGRALLRITDNGQGFDTQQAHPGHFGLENMQARAAELGCTLSISSTLGEGTCLSVEVGAQSDVP
jgi:signal transduction histidine kinase